MTTDPIVAQTRAVRIQIVAELGDDPQRVKEMLYDVERRWKGPVAAGTADVSRVAAKTSSSVGTVRS